MSFRLRKLPILLLSLCLAQASGAAANSDGDALNFTATTLDGHQFQGNSLSGKATLIDFWAVWCAPCIQAFPKLNELHNRFDPSRFQLLGMAVYSGSSEEVKAFLSDHQLEYRVVVGEAEVVDKFEIFGFPTYVLLNSRGEVVKKYVGSMDRLFEKIVSDIEAVLAFDELSCKELVKPKQGHHAGLDFQSFLE